MNIPEGVDDGLIYQIHPLDPTQKGLLTGATIGQTGRAIVHDRS